MRLRYRLVGWFVAVAALTGGWVLLAGRADRWELAAATFAGVVGVTVGALAHRHSGLEHRPDPALVRAAPALLRDAASDLWWCARVLLGHLRGRPHEGEWIEVDLGVTGQDPDDVARRTAISVVGSFAATTYVADLDTDAGTVLVHRLTPTGREVLPARLTGSA